MKLSAHTLSQRWRKFIGKLVKKEFASGQLKILLIHAMTTFKSSHHSSRWALQETHARIQSLSSFCHSVATVVRQGWKLIWFTTFVEQDLVSSSHSDDSRLTLFIVLKLWNKILRGS
jgi:hypothetical protein